VVPVVEHPLDAGVEVVDDVELVLVELVGAEVLVDVDDGDVVEVVAPLVVEVVAPEVVDVVAPLVVEVVAPLVVEVVAPEVVDVVGALVDEVVPGGAVVGVVVVDGHGLAAPVIAPDGSESSSRQPLTANVNVAARMRFEQATVSIAPMIPLRRRRSYRLTGEQHHSGG
jgi:hypothetical protein